MKSEYEIASTFIFQCKDNISSGIYTIHKEGDNDIYINIDRRIRTKPLVGMDQPTPLGGMLGWEASLKIKDKGKIGDGYKWQLYKNRELIQKGRTDEKGIGSLDIEIENTHEYMLEIFRPVREEVQDQSKTE